MRVLICGAGDTTSQLLKQMGENWEVVLIDPEKERLQDFVAAHPCIQRIQAGDASSPVVLEDAGLENADYVLALTGSDKVNLAIAEHARKKEVGAVLALAHEQLDVQAFRDLGARVILPGRVLAQNIYHYLQDPRIKVHPLDITEAEVVEIDAADHFALVGRRISALVNAEWRIVALYREGRILFPEPDMRVGKTDRLIILGQRDVFNNVCSLMECGLPHFPLTYGQTLVIQLPEGSGVQEVLQEGLYVTQNTRVQKVRVVAPEDTAPGQTMFDQWPQSRLPRVETYSAEEDLRVLHRVCQAQNTGLVLRPPLVGSWADIFKRPPHVELAHSLGCPLLLGRGAKSYERIAVAFNGSSVAVAGMEVAIDVARQTGGTIEAIVVQESDVVQGPGGGEWVDDVLASLRELAHVHKIAIAEQLREGNPVREIVAAAAESDVVVMGCSRAQKRLLTPNIPELVTRRTKGSVLLVPVV